MIAPDGLLAGWLWPEKSTCLHRDDRNVQNVCNNSSRYCFAVFCCKFDPQWIASHLNRRSSQARQFQVESWHLVCSVHVVHDCLLLILFAFFDPFVFSRLTRFGQLTHVQWGRAEPGVWGVEAMASSLLQEIYRTHMSNLITVYYSHLLRFL